MKKFIVVAMGMLMLVGAANAAQIHITDVLDEDSGTYDVPPFFFEGTKGNQNDEYNTTWFREADWSYTHNVTAEYASQLAAIEAGLTGTQYIDSITLTLAELSIDAFDTDTPNCYVWGDGINLGYLTVTHGPLPGGPPGGGWAVTTFSGLTTVEDNILNVTLDFPNDGNRITVDSSTLELKYDVTIAERIPEPIPAPGAVLLSGLGAGLVGWLRRRRSL